MSDEAPADAQLHPLPGLDVVGRGLYLRPHHPYELKRSLFEQRDPRPFHSREAKRAYLVPAGYEVNESPPPPTGVALNSVTIEESWERFSRARSLDVGTAGGWLAFSLDVSAHTGTQLRSEYDAYYAVRSSFIALWSVYLEDPSRPSVELELDHLPTPFAPEHRRVYDEFFQRYGTHFVKRAWVGGKAEVMARVDKTSTLSREDINAGLQASFGIPGLLPPGRVKRNLERSREALVKQSRTMVVGRGGDEYRLAAMSSLDEAVFNSWLATIRSNPQTIELDLAGIWTLVRDPAKSQALHDAYLAAASFAPLSAMVSVDDVVYFTRGLEMFSYDLSQRKSSRPCPMRGRWPALDTHEFERIDAALRAPEQPTGRAVYLIRKDKTLRMDIDTGAVYPGYPRPVSEQWPGVEFDHIDAAMRLDDSLYFFAGELYTRFNLRSGSVDPGYPARMCERWIGVTFDRIDAALRWSDGKIYFFRGDQYICYDPVTLRADPDYPKAIVGSYVEDWSLFE